MNKSKYIYVICQYCGKKIKKANINFNFAKKNNKPLFCNHSCSNKYREKNVVLICKWCSKKFKPNLNRKQIKFCSISCAGLFFANNRYINFIEKWKNGLISSEIFSAHIRKYLFEINSSKCELCGWSEKNIKTGKIPLDVEHIDGNCKNNKKENLKLLCPNCHSLTPTYKSLNYGKSKRGKKNEK